MNSLQHIKINNNFQSSYALSAYANLEILPLNEIVDRFIKDLWDPKNKTASIASWFVPYLVSTLFGGGILGFLAAVLSEVYGVEIKEILVDIVNEIQKLLGLSDGDVDPSKIDPSKLDDKSLIDQALDYVKNKYETTIAETKASIEKLKKSIIEGSSKFLSDTGADILKKLKPDFKFDLFKSDDINYKISYRTEQLLLIKNSNNNYQLVKTAGTLSFIYNTIFKKIFDLFKSLFSALLSKLKFKLLGEGVKALVTDKKNIFTDKPGILKSIVSPAPTVPKITSKTPTQTVFPPNPSYKDQDYYGTLWQENIQNNSENIKNLLLHYAKDCYNGLSERKDLNLMAEHSDDFKRIQNIIESQNELSVGANIVIIPSAFSNKKNIVNFFIDEFADFAKELDKNK